MVTMSIDISKNENSMKTLLLCHGVFECKYIATTYKHFLIPQPLDWLTP